MGFLFLEVEEARKIMSIFARNAKRRLILAQLPRGSETVFRAASDMIDRVSTFLQWSKAGGESLEDMMHYTKQFNSVLKQNPIGYVSSNFL